jgi:hypothetical protein
LRLREEYLVKTKPTIQVPPRGRTREIVLSEKEVTGLIVLLDRVQVQVIERDRGPVQDWMAELGRRVDSLHKGQWTQKEYAECKALIEELIDTEQATTVTQAIPIIAGRMRHPEWKKNRDHPVWAMARRHFGTR